MGTTDLAINLQLSVPLPFLPNNSAIGTIRIENLGTSASSGVLVVYVEQSAPPIFLDPGTCRSGDFCGPSPYEFCAGVPLIVPSSTYECTIEVIRQPGTEGIFGTYRITGQILGDGNSENNTSTVQLQLGNPVQLPTLEPVFQVACILLLAFVTAIFHRSQRLEK